MSAFQLSGLKRNRELIASYFPDYPSTSTASSTSTKETYYTTNKRTNLLPIAQQPQPTAGNLINVQQPLGNPAAVQQPPGNPAAVPLVAKTPARTPKQGKNVNYLQFDAYLSALKRGQATIIKKEKVSDADDEDTDDDKGARIIDSKDDTNFKGGDVPTPVRVKKEKTAMQKRASLSDVEAFVKKEKTATNKLASSSDVEAFDKDGKPISYTRNRSSNNKAMLLELNQQGKPQFQKTNLADKNKANQKKPVTVSNK